METDEMKNMEGQVVGGKDVFIAPGATVIGDVRLGDNVSIWYGAVLRGDTDSIRVGDRSNIQDGCILHTDSEVPVEIGEDVTVGHAAVIHGAAVGNNTLIGIGAVLLSRVKVGRNCIVGAHALLTEGTEIPDRSMAFGSPAKIVRPVTEEEVERNKESARHYVKNGLRYLGKTPAGEGAEAKAEPPATGERLQSLRGKMNLPAEPGQRPARNLELQQNIYRESVLPLVERVVATLEPINDFFESFELNCTGEAIGKNADKARILAELKSFFDQTRHRYFNINFNWNNLKKGGADAFGHYIPLQIELEAQHYHVNRNNNNLKTYSKTYDEPLSPEEQQAIADEMLGNALDYIERHLQS